MSGHEEIEDVELLEGLRQTIEEEELALKRKKAREMVHPKTARKIIDRVITGMPLRKITFSSLRRDPGSVLVAEGFEIIPQKNDYTFCVIKTKLVGEDADEVPLSDETRDDSLHVITIGVARCSRSNRFCKAQGQLIALRHALAGLHLEMSSRNLTKDLETQADVEKVKALEAIALGSVRIVNQKKIFLLRGWAVTVARIFERALERELPMSSSHDYFWADDYPHFYTILPKEGPESIQPPAFDSGGVGIES